MSNKIEDGDYVVKPWKLMELEYGLALLGTIRCPMGFNSDMESALPLDRVIRIKNSAWKGYGISPEMLLGPHFEYLEEIEVRDSEGKEWETYYFLGYTPGIEYPIDVAGDLEDISSTSSSFRYARKLQPKEEEKPTPPSINISININGEPVSLEQALETLSSLNQNQ